MQRHVHMDVWGTMTVLSTVSLMKNVNVFLGSDIHS